MQRSTRIATTMAATAVAMVTTALLAGCRGSKDAKANEAAKTGAPASLPVSVLKATEEDVPRRVEVTGTLAAWEEATVSLEADGRLVDVRVDLGDKVQKGAVLARIASEAHEYRKAQAEAELAAADSDFKRLESLAGKDMATRQQLDESKRRLGMARASADLARKQFLDTTLRAPIGGMVSRRMINPGEYVRTGTPALVLVRTSPLKLRLDVPERHLADVKVGDRVEVTGEALPPGRALVCSVSRIGPAVATDTRAFPVEARCDNEDGAMKPGIFARATIQTGTRARSVLIPEAAVTVFAGNPRVFVVDGGTVKERTIEIIGRYQGRVLVGKGLTAGETIATSGIDRLADGTPVTIREAEKQP